MLEHNIKFNQAVFEYYLLHITPKIRLEQVKSKLINFKKLDQSNNNIVVVIDGKFETEQLHNTINVIKAYAGELGILFHSIAANEFVSGNEIAEIPVINLPHIKKSDHIYNKTLIYDEPVRSGIKLENDGDIIVSSFVSDNAEIVATGSIHIYGEARGKLIAGSAGNRAARIFATKFNAELIAIGGIYKVIESKLPASIHCKAVMISLDDKERLNVAPL